MEKFYNILRKALVIIGVFSMTSCDFLETEPFDFVSPTTFYRNESECTMALAAVYYPMATNILYGNFYSTEMTNIDDLSYYTRNSNFSGNYGQMTIPAAPKRSGISGRNYIPELKMPTACLKISIKQRWMNL